MLKHQSPTTNILSQDSFHLHNQIPFKVDDNDYYCYYYHYYIVNELVRVDLFNF